MRAETWPVARVWSRDTIPENTSMRSPTHTHTYKLKQIKDSQTCFYASNVPSAINCAPRKKIILKAILDGRHPDCKIGNHTNQSDAAEVTNHITGTMLGSHFTLALSTMASRAAILARRRSSAISLSCSSFSAFSLAFSASSARLRSSAARNACVKKTTNQHSGFNKAGEQCQLRLHQVATDHLQPRPSRCCSSKPPNTELPRQRTHDGHSTRSTGLHTIQYHSQITENKPRYAGNSNASKNMISFEECTTLLRTLPQRAPPPQPPRRQHSFSRLSSPRASWATLIPAVHRFGTLGILVGPEEEAGSRAMKAAG